MSLVVVGVDLLSLSDVRECEMSWGRVGSEVGPIVYVY